MANPWDNDTLIEPAKPTATSAKKAQPRKYSSEAAMAALRKSDAIMNEGLKKLSAPQRKKALANYYASPTVQRLRENANLPAVRTRQEELADIARKQFRQEKKWRPEGDFGAATRSANSRMMFGIPERIGAALNYYGGVSDPGIKSYDEELNVQRQVTDLQRDRSVAGNVFGSLAGGVTGAKGAGSLVNLAGQGVAKIPGAAGVGNFIQNLTRLQQGARAGNAAKIVAAGASGGGAQALGEGSDVATGTAFGALAAPAIVGGVKALSWAAQPVKDFLRVTGASKILRRYTTMTAEEMSQAAARFRQQTGTEPTPYELLPEGDRQALQGALRTMPAASRERATGLVRERVGNMPRELSDRTAAITAPQQRFVARELATEMATARGATAPTADELALARRAVRDPSEMEMVRRTVDRSIMAPFDSQVAYQSLDELIPTVPVRQGSTVVQQVADQEVANVIRSVAGTRRMSPDGFTVRDISDMMSDLRADVGKGGIEGRAAQGAINHLEDLLGRDFPDAADAMARMVQSHAARSRMMEGVAEGRATRLREDVPVRGARDANKVRNAYETPEGAGGRAMGQRAQLMSEFEATPNRAIARAGEIAESPATQEAIARNLGTQAGDEIGEMAGAQAESLRRLGSLRNTSKGDDGDAMDFGDLAMSMSLLSPTALLRTKSQAVTTILRVLQGIPEGRANQLVDALFSQNPAQMANAIRLLESAGERGARALRDIGAAMIAGQQAGGIIANVDEARPADVPAEIEVTAEEIPVEEEAPWEADEQLDAGEIPYGRAVIEALFPGSTVTDDVRDPNSELAQKNPNSYHVSTDGAVDVRPIPGMTFDEFVARLQDEGYEIIEAIDEVNNPSGHATGPHWHVVFA